MLITFIILVDLVLTCVFVKAATNLTPEQRAGVDHLGAAFLI